MKSDLDIRPVFHKTDGGIRAYLNLAVLAYWIVSVTKYRLRMKDYPNVRWDEIMRIAQAQVVVTSEMETVDGDRIRVSQSTEAEEELPSSTVCWMSMPTPSEKSNPWYTQIHLQKIRLLRTKGLREIYLQCGLRATTLFHFFT